MQTFTGSAPIILIILLTILSKAPTSPMIVKNKTAKINIAPVAATLEMPLLINLPSCPPLPITRQAITGTVIKAAMVDIFLLMIKARTATIVIKPTIANIQHPPIQSNFK